MAYRYQTQVFANMVDGNGVNVVDYADKSSSVKMAAIPIQDAKKTRDVFNKTSSIV